MRVSAWIRRSAMVAACVLALGLDALAQSSEGKSDRSGNFKWWALPSARAELGLSAKDAEAIEQIFQSTVPTLREQYRALKSEESTLEKLLDEGKADEDRVGDAIERVETARASLAKTRALMLYRMHRLLTPDQRALLKQWHERRDRTREGKDLDGRG